MTTTRYAIELEPGKWWNNYAHWTDAKASQWKFERAILLGEHSIDYWLTVCKQHYPHARIVPVKCEVEDEA